ncbi:glycosyltransferase family 4 protein [Aureisphaera sp. CAU 1614]|uniref:Glycosyltransferase family 4 protein n=1 Tax=Halomarinibacterium sedimenti TaxID=2857106 RepID=A0A9X1FNT5_9FLAO|nr:glycosyltransferase family 4 protein [Halomarinibacterium sedimenti]MBW2937851.1 glycosyltransferase family 4 protein [Halomarinibacterium sedimenti]
MMQLISLFQEAGYTITFASTASETEYSETLQHREITTRTILLNNASFDSFVTELNPSIVLFDRYITEEQFGWRVAENCPNALRILDTEDLHFLRKAREEAFKKNMEIDLFSETAKRELASIIRSDLSLIISEAEMTLLKDTFQIPLGILYYLPFLFEENSENVPSFQERQHFISIGNFLHAPNVDAVVFLKNDIWPKIKQQLPEAELHIYGAYAPKHILEMHNKKEGFIIKGWAENVKTVMEKAKVCLAPLRFGAGLKGKLLDAAINGTPAVTTSIGAEGMYTIAISREDVSAFVDASVPLYSQEKIWKEQQKEAFQVVAKHFKRENFSKDFIEKINRLQTQLKQHRQAHFMGQILQHQSLQATKFMSKWIEEKHKIKAE